MLTYFHQGNYFSFRIPGSITVKNRWSTFCNIFFFQNLEFDTFKMQKQWVNGIQIWNRIVYCWVTFGNTYVPYSKVMVKKLGHLLQKKVILNVQKIRTNMIYGGRTLNNILCNTVQILQFMFIVQSLQLVNLPTYTIIIWICSCWVELRKSSWSYLKKKKK